MNKTALPWILAIVTFSTGIACHAQDVKGPYEHLKLGHDYFGTKEYRAAAGHIRQGGEILKQAAPQASAERKAELAKAVAALETLADEVDEGALESAEPLEEALAHGQLAMAAYHHERATAAVKKRDSLAAAREADAAAVQLKCALTWANVNVSSTAWRAISQASELREEARRGNRVGQGAIAKAVETIKREIYSLRLTLSKRKP